MQATLYFYDSKGREIADHKLQGRRFVGIGPAMTVSGDDVDANPASPVWEDKQGRKARHTLYVKGHKVTTADFPGMRHVLVKVWTTGQTSWLWLVPERNKLNTSWGGSSMPPGPFVMAKI